jgi:hypothetical protein
MYTLVMFDFITEDKYWIEEDSESVEISLYGKRKCFCFSSFPKKEFLLIPIDKSM